MSGLDDGTIWQSIAAQTKQYGAILRGFGPPVPGAGNVGDLYIDTLTWFLYVKRDAQGANPWGSFLFVVPATYRNTLKWFSAYLPGNDVGVNGDYCLLWGAYNNYGLQPSIFGPKVNGSWPESGDGPATLLDPTYAGAELPVGLSDEGSATSFSTSTQMIVAGLADEYVLAIPVLQVASTPVSTGGLLSSPVNVAVDLNPLYSVENEHAV